MMKKNLKLIVAFTLVMLCFEANAQTQKKDWHNGSFEKDGVYGAEVDKAYEFLGKKKSKYRPVVAIISSGVDIEHEALVKNIWTNKREKADGLDNDGNGLIDDLHGWNFLGQKDGTTMSQIGTEGDREWFRLKDKYANLMYDGKEYFEYIDGKRTTVTTPVDHEEYCYFRSLNYESQIASTYAGYTLSYYIRDLAVELFGELRAKYPNKKNLTYADFKTLDNLNKREREDSLFAIGCYVLGMQLHMPKQYSTDSIDIFLKVENSYKDGSRLAGTLKIHEDLLKTYPFGVREKMVGDTGMDIDNRSYGNNVLLTPNSSIGTAIASIVAGERGVEGRTNPICQNAEIMPLVVSVPNGDAYLKDVALAIRYAVDNHADVICFTLPSTFYPKDQRIWVEEAMKYAEEMGTLILINIGEYSQNIDQTIYYPNRFMIEGRELTNVMMVSTSEQNGNSTLKSSFGEKYVDLFAPGIDMLVGFVGDNYKIASNSNLSMAVVAGVAALVKSYYPKLTGSQIRTLLNENVTSREGIELEKIVNKNGEMIQDAYLFDELCISKGIVNAYKAIQAAEKMKL